MSGRHRARTHTSHLIIGSLSAAVGISSVLSAAIVELVMPEQPAAAPQAVQQEPLTQQGRLIAVSPDSITTRGDDGSIQTFAITPNTAAIGLNRQTGTAGMSFALNDAVTVVGTRQGDTVVATAVADQAAVGPQGAPMDYGY